MNDVFSIKLPEDSDLIKAVDRFDADFLGGAPDHEQFPVGEPIPEDQKKLDRKEWDEDAHPRQANGEFGEGDSEKEENSEEEPAKPSLSKEEQDFVDNFDPEEPSTWGLSKREAGSIQKLKDS